MLFLSIQVSSVSFLTCIKTTAQKAGEIYMNLIVALKAILKRLCIYGQ